MTQLLYRSHCMIEDLAVGECTIHRASGSSAAKWWQIWFNVLRETDGVAEVFCVPVNPRGGFIEAGADGRRTWGFNPVDAGETVWQVSPSIDVVNDGDAHADGSPKSAPLPSLWHQTPSVVGVPAGESWTKGPA